MKASWALLNPLILVLITWLGSQLKPTTLTVVDELKTTINLNKIDEAAKSKTTDKLVTERRFMIKFKYEKTEWHFVVLKKKRHEQVPKATHGTHDVSMHLHITQPLQRPQGKST